MQQNHDEMAEKYISAVENQKQSEKQSDKSFTRGDMETCFVAGCQSMERLQEGCEGSFGQAVGSLKHGFLVRRKGWNGKGMFLFMRPFDELPDKMITEQVKSLPYNFKEWVRHHPCEGSSRFFGQYLCMKAADGSIVNGWLASQTDILAEDWVLVSPDE